MSTSNILLDVRIMTATFLPSSHWHSGAQCSGPVIYKWGNQSVQGYIILLRTLHWLRYPQVRENLLVSDIEIPTSIPRVISSVQLKLCNLYNLIRILI